MPLAIVKNVSYSVWKNSFIEKRDEIKILENISFDNIAEALMYRMREEM